MGPTSGVKGREEQKKTGENTSRKKHCCKAVLNLEEKAVILKSRAANNSRLKIREQSVEHSAGMWNEKNNNKENLQSNLV